MPSDDEEYETEPQVLADTTPCCANVWDPVLKAYRSCDEWADPASDSDLCTKHHERVTAIVSLINAAQAAARMDELEMQPWGHTVA